MNDEFREPLSEAHLDSEAEQLIGAYLSEYLELEETLGARPPLHEFEQKVPEHLRERFRAAVHALLWLEPLRSGVSGAASSGAHPEEQVSEGERFGEYLLCRKLGAGMMGSVYEAVHRTLKRRVALKVMAPWLANEPGYRERFLREAQAAARLHHTNIAPVFEVGECAGRLFYAMHFVDGVPLDRILALARERRSAQTGEAESAELADMPAWARSLAEQAAAGGGMPADEVVRWGMQVASALQHAHACGVVHRDIKPSNLILDADGRVWLVDFGLAAVFDDPSLTRPGAMVGTPRYMSPEQARGEPVGPAADIYSLGAVLLEALCLRPLVEGDSVEDVLRQIRDGIPHLSLPAHVPSSLRVVLLRCLEGDPSRRYRSASELLEDLRRVSRGEPVRGMRFVLFRRFLSTCRRYKGTVATAAILGTLALGLAIWRHVDVTRAWRRAEQSARKADEALRLSRKRLGETLLADAGSLLNSSWAGRVPQALNRLRAAESVVSEFPELRPRWRNLLAQAIQTPDLIAEPIRFPPVADPVAQLLSGSAAPAPRPVAVVDLLPDPDQGVLFLITADGVLAEVQGESARTVGSVPPGAGRLVGAGADAIWVAGDSGVWRLRRDNGTAVSVFESGPLDLIAFHEQGGVALLSAGLLRVIRNGTRYTLPLPAGSARVETLAWDREGKRLFLGDASGRLVVYSVQLRRQVMEADIAAAAGTVAYVTSCSVLPSGEVVVGLSDGSVRLLSPQLAVIDTFRGHREAVRWVVPFRDGVRLLSCDGREFLLWSLPTGELIAPRFEPGNGITQVAADTSRDDVLYRTEDGVWQRLRALPPDQTVRVCTASEATLVGGAVLGTRRVAWVDRAGRVGVVELAENGFEVRVFPLLTPARGVAACAGGLWLSSAEGREVHWVESGTGRHRFWSLESPARAVCPLLPTRAVVVTASGAAHLAIAEEGVDRLSLNGTVVAGCSGRHGPTGERSVYLLLEQGKIVRVDAKGQAYDEGWIPLSGRAGVDAVLFPWLLFETEDGVWLVECESGHYARVMGRDEAEDRRVLAASILPGGGESSALYRLVIQSATAAGPRLSLLSGSVRRGSAGLVLDQGDVDLRPLLIQSVHAAAFGPEGAELWLFGGPRERGRTGPGLLEIWRLNRDPHARTPLQTGPGRSKSLAPAAK